MKRNHNTQHLAFIRQLPCVICGDNTTVEAAHIRFASRRAGKRATGMGEKPDDCWTVPLCGRHHREQHDMNELMFWTESEIDPIFVALALWNATGNIERAETIISSAFVIDRHEPAL